MNQEESDLELFKKHCTNDDVFYETEEFPMIPNLFYQLSMIIGFNKINGANYTEYIDKWLIRTKKNST